jgi:hypothetical protein
MDTLIFLAAEAKKEDAWLEFSRFCELRGRGVRAAAMEQLGKFIQAAVAWSFEKRLAFSQWALWRSRNFRDDRLVLPHPIREHLIVPTLRMWREASPDAPDPHLWLGLLGCDDPSHHLDQALKRDPSCELARQKFTDLIFRDIAYSQHELPGFYLGRVEDDLKELEKASELVSGSKAEVWARGAQRRIAVFRARAEDWMALRSRANNVVPFPGMRPGEVPSDGK